MQHATAVERQRLLLRGRVQGVGLRPFLCRLAGDLGLRGWVGNTPEGVVIEAEGAADVLAQFQRRLRQEAPPQARIADCVVALLPASGQDADFRVADSCTTGAPEPCAPPDLAPCPDCLRELFDPADRRYRYPFLSCTACGPRYSILDALPFDRERTAMASFPLCAACHSEYHDPADRRFHAQTMACSDCGPQLALRSAQGQTLARGDQALHLAVEALREGRIVALKGVGGFQLLADAGNAGTIETLRISKQRPHKPFALLADLAMARQLCRIEPEEEAELISPAAPIVLLRRDTHGGNLSRAIAPDLPWLGIMLPASPLHQLLLADFGAPLVATSGNRSGEPICIDETEALSRLGDIADLFLVHDRPILRPLDDSVLRVAAGRPLLLRRARGYVPEAVDLAEALPPSLALGGHLKNTVAVGQGERAILSQHLGDLDDVRTQQQCRATAEELIRLFGITPKTVACDAHPDYASRRLAEDTNLPLRPVPHHYAHALACMAEHGVAAPALAIAWDGIGLGDDGGLWGGEFLHIGPQGYRRVASLLPLRLPGGERAVKEPRRVALAALHEIYGSAARHPNAGFTPAEQTALQAMLERGVNAPQCSSVGRLFDAVASLLGLCQINSFEGQAAMLLEAAAWEAAQTAPPAVMALIEDEHEPLRLDWRPLLRQLLSGQEQGLARSLLAYQFHASLAATAVAVAQRFGLAKIILCGGCFQNRLLVELCTTGLRQAGFEAYWPQHIPPNDGGLALGQLLAAGRQMQEN